MVPLEAYLAGRLFLTWEGEVVPGDCFLPGRLKWALGGYLLRPQGLLFTWEGKEVTRRLFLTLSEAVPHLRGWSGPPGLPGRVKWALLTCEGEVISRRLLLTWEGEVISEGCFLPRLIKWSHGGYSLPGWVAVIPWGCSLPGWVAVIPLRLFLTWVGCGDTPEAVPYQEGSNDPPEAVPYLEGSNAPREAVPYWKGQMFPLRLSLTWKGQMLSWGCS